jgi:hypothetical protein
VVLSSPLQRLNSCSCGIRVAMVTQRTSTLVAHLDPGDDSSQLALRARARTRIASKEVVLPHCTPVRLPTAQRCCTTCVPLSSLEMQTLNCQGHITARPTWSSSSGSCPPRNQVSVEWNACATVPHLQSVVAHTARYLRALTSR